MYQRYFLGKIRENGPVTINRAPLQADNRGTLISPSVASGRTSSADNARLSAGLRAGTSSSPGGAASLDTEALTQRVGLADTHNPTGQQFRALAARSQWQAELKQLTKLVREAAAGRLESRGRALALDRRRLWRRSGMVERDAVGRPTGDTGSPAAAFWRASTSPETGRAAPASPKRCEQWHASRARTKREMFERVAKCGTGEGTQITLACRGCANKIALEVGCNSHWFCASCRKRTAQRFRLDFERKRLGIVTAAARAGLTRRNQRKGDRWGERMLTVTLPHVGTPRERIITLRATWARFWRVLQDALRPRLTGECGIKLTELPARPEGFPADRPLELTFNDLLSYLHVFEWTPGDDGLGHPHLHVWLFSKRLDRDWLQELWEESYAHVTKTPRQKLAMVHIEAAGEDVASELVKYLTKDWEITPDGAKRARPEVFAEVFAELDGRRRRQTSSGFSIWAAEKVCACPACGYERERGHWARVDISHALEEVTDEIGRRDWAPDTGTPLTAADVALKAKEDAQRDREWASSWELAIVRARLAPRLPDPPKGDAWEGD